MPLARSCAGHSLPAPHSSLHGQGRREWLHAQSGEPERPWTVFWTPSQAWACHRLFGYPLGWGVYLERVGWRPGAQKREGLPLVPFSLVPDRVTTANGPGGAQVHDLAENHGDITQLQSYAEGALETSTTAGTHARVRCCTCQNTPPNAESCPNPLSQGPEPVPGSIFPEQWGLAHVDRSPELGWGPCQAASPASLHLRAPEPGPAGSSPTLILPGRQSPHCPQGSGPGTALGRPH